VSMRPISASTTGTLLRLDGDRTMSAPRPLAVEAAGITPSSRLSATGALDVGRRDDHREAGATRRRAGRGSGSPRAFPRHDREPAGLERRSLGVVGRGGGLERSVGSRRPRSPRGTGRGWLSPRRRPRSPPRRAVMTAGSAPVVEPPPVFRPCRPAITMRLSSGGARNRLPELVEHDLGDVVRWCRGPRSHEPGAGPSGTRTRASSRLSMSSRLAMPCSRTRTHRACRDEEAGLTT